MTGRGADPVSGRVVVVGSINADLVVSVSSLPGPGETVTGGTFARHGGGKGANQAVAAARMGAEVAFVGAVGDDDMGADALRELASEGVDVRAVARLAGVPTGVALITVDAAGENTIAVASGANAALDGVAARGALEDGLLAGDPGVVLLGHEVPDAVVLAGARAAREAGWAAVLNPAPARALTDELVALAPLLTPNASEAAALTGEDDPEAAARALAGRTGAPVLVTVGADGALLARGAGGDSAAGRSQAPTGGDDDPPAHGLLAAGGGDASRVERLPAPRVEVVDTTGAGDTFNGALAAELAAGAELADAARTAIAAAARSTGSAGARGGMPRRADLELPARG